MGRVFSSLKRELKSFNVDSRALKEISKESIRPPPKYPSTQKEIETIKKDYGVSVEDLTKKDKKLDEYLKNIYVTSENMSSTPESNRELPQSRISDFSVLEYGYVEPETVSLGKITLKNTLELLSRHNKDPSNWSPSKLASHYNVEVKFVEQLIERYRVFELHLPDKMTEQSKKATLASKIQLQMALQNIHKLTLVKNQQKDKEKPETPGSMLEGVKPS